MQDRPLEDWEYPEPDDEFEEETSCTEPCPACGAAVYEDAQRCPACGEYVAMSQAGRGRWPWWVAALGMAGIAAVVVSLIWGTI